MEVASMVPSLAPGVAADPRALCEWLAAVQGGLRQDALAPGPPVLWMAPLPAQYARARDRIGDGSSRGPELLLQPLWWAGSEWHELPDIGTSPHAVTQAAYAPRQYEPVWHRGGGLLRLTEDPLEVGPGHEGITDHGGFQVGAQQPHSVMRVLRLVLCHADGRLWARPQVGGHWELCPYELSDIQLVRTEAFEVCGGDRYVLLLRGAGARSVAGSFVVCFDVKKNSWFCPIGASRAVGGRHCGEPPVRWRPVEARASSAKAPLIACILEASSKWLTLISRVSRDGVQRSGAEDVHTAIHFLGCDGEVVTHHLACGMDRLTAQRYDDYVAIIKDVGEHPWRESACMDDNWQASDGLVAGWLLSMEDVAIPPLEIHLPSHHECWSGGGCDWSVVLSRGCLAGATVDAAPRLYMLEIGDAVLRLWVSRRVDDAFGTRYQEHTLDGVRHVRHALSFDPLPHTELTLPERSEPEVSSVGSLALWSPDLRHAVRAGGPRLRFWRCALAFAGPGTADPRASAPRAHAAALMEKAVVSTAELMPMRPSWHGLGAPADICRGGSVVDGLPCFPTLRWGEASFQCPEDRWHQHIGRDAAQVPSSATLR
eukprot:TRINITY_DN22315_c0_g1_i1.p1 TRINITY_DN22315_c0_g1~~TRINITY_DN22315_c0_g1_i1.p1  ORF type:complete len:598 (+),score=89.37 TRINITY_DN22315_c0_g1_i1:47-1840(+)